MGNISKFFLISIAATGVLNASGPSWKAQRAFTLGVFRRFGVGKAVFETQICSELEQLFKLMDSQEGASFDPTRLIQTSISNVNTLVTLANRYPHGDKGFDDLMHTCDQIVKLAGTAGFKNIVKVLRLLPSKANEILAKAKNDFMAIVDGHIQRRKATYDMGKTKCLIDVYSKKVYNNEDLGPHVHDETVAKTVAALYMAGTDTSSFQILWVLVYLLRHPQVMRKVRNEIDEVVGRDRLPTMDDQTDMPFTQAVINECMRLCAPVPMGVMHAASDDTTLMGYTIPKGTLFMANLWGIHNDPDTWKEPHKFNPARFLDENGHLIENEALMPFSTGENLVLVLSKP